MTKNRCGVGRLKVVSVSHKIVYNFGSYRKGILLSVFRMLHLRSQNWYGKKIKIIYVVQTHFSKNETHAWSTVFKTIIYLPLNIPDLCRLHSETLAAVLQLRAELWQNEQTCAQNMFVNVLLRISFYLNNYSRILFIRFAWANEYAHEGLFQFTKGNLKKKLFFHKSILFSQYIVSLLGSYGTRSLKCNKKLEYLSYSEISLEMLKWRLPIQVD